MYSIYSLLLTLGFLLMLPLFLLRREKYASGFKQRLGNYPAFNHDGRKVIWLHCVSVGETNAARPLVDQLLTAFPDHRLIISTTTKTGQELAQKIFVKKADAVIYFPFDWKFSVRKALANYKPSLILLMETEIWPRFIREAKLSGAKVAIVNGRLSERSFQRYSKVRLFIKKVLADVDLALMQGDADAERVELLGIDKKRINIAGNLKFDLDRTPTEIDLAENFKERYRVSSGIPFIIAASTHHKEEGWVLDALEIAGYDFRLLIAPRHPERFAEVADLIKNYSFVQRSAPESELDRSAQIILLDSVGELRQLFILADIVFVGGSLIPHGGQSVLEPAEAGKAIIVGPFTQNFDAIVAEFRGHDALIQIPEATEREMPWNLYEAFSELLSNTERRKELGRNARSTIESNRGATAKTIQYLKTFRKPSNK